MPLIGQGAGKLFDFIGVKWFSEIEKIVTLGNVNNVTRLVFAESSDDNNFYLRIEHPDSTGSLGPVDTRHIHINKRDGKGQIVFNRLLDSLDPCFSIFGQD